MFINLLDLFLIWKYQSIPYGSNWHLVGGTPNFFAGTHFGKHWSRLMMIKINDLPQKLFRYVKRHYTFIWYEAILFLSWIFITNTINTLTNKIQCFEKGYKWLGTALHHAILKIRHTNFQISPINKSSLFRIDVKSSYQITHNL